jgi:isochorismate hydrolase
MSASERLKALVSDYWENEPPEGPEAPDVVIAALPQIVAVVEEAERYNKREGSILDQALRALEEALS